MDYETSEDNNNISLDINKKVNEIFARIIDDLPKEKNGNALISSKEYLAVTNNNQVINYTEFYNLVYRIVSIYMPEENEHPLAKAISLFPRAIRNIKRLKINKKIIELQNKILNTYFIDLENEKNIKKKIIELKEAVKEILKKEVGEERDYIIAQTLCSFEDRIREDLLRELEELSKYMEERNKL